jgi:hypothetical protein
MLAVKDPLTLERIEAQTAVELPDREAPVTVVIGCLALCVGQITIRDVTVDVAATICAGVNALNVALLGVAGTNIFSCTTRNH